jgi:hypothetical protein
MSEPQVATGRLPGKTRGVTPWGVVGDPEDTEEGLEGYVRVSFDVRARDYDYFGRLATYRNTLAKVKGIKLRRQWTRKSVGEQLLGQRADEYRLQIAEMVQACGDLPAADDEVAMRAYAIRVIAWDKKRPK